VRAILLAVAKARILVVEDDPQTVAAVRLYLEGDLL